MRGLRRICISVAEAEGVVEKEFPQWGRKRGGVGGMVWKWKSRERMGEKKEGECMVVEVLGEVFGLLRECI